MLNNKNEHYMKPLINPSGVTIKELKEYIKDLPEVDEDTGELYEVWIGVDVGNSSPCKSILHLSGGDLCFEIEA